MQLSLDCTATRDHQLYSVPFGRARHNREIWSLVPNLLEVELCKVFTNPNLLALDDQSGYVTRRQRNFKIHNHLIGENCSLLSKNRLVNLMFQQKVN